MWVGIGASDTEKQGAHQLCGILGVSTSEIAEGGESGKLLTWLYSLEIYSENVSLRYNNKRCNYKLIRTVTDYFHIRACPQDLVTYSN